MIAILLALGAAVSYGLSDFVGGVFSKRASPWAVAFVGQVAGAVLMLGIWALVAGDATGRDVGWALLAGVGNGLGTVFLYRGLSSGRMGVVAPVSGVGAALLPVAVGLLAGERPAVLVWLGIVAAMPGIWLVAREPTTGDVAGDAAPGSGVLDGVMAGLGFGTLFAALAQIPESAGVTPLVINQAVGATVIVLAALVVRASWVPAVARGVRRRGQRRPGRRRDRRVPARQPAGLPRP